MPAGIVLDCHHITFLYLVMFLCVFSVLCQGHFRDHRSRSPHWNECNLHIAVNYVHLQQIPVYYQSEDLGNFLLLNFFSCTMLVFRFLCSLLQGYYLFAPCSLSYLKPRSLLSWAKRKTCSQIQYDREQRLIYIYITDLFI